MSKNDSFTNLSLNSANKNKNDEFYTTIDTIELELQYYTNFLRGKSILCPCNDLYNNFWIYFVDNFKRLGIKQVVATKYDLNESGRPSIAGVFDEDGFKVLELKDNGSFLGKSCQSFFNECDIVITNPPWSLAEELLKLCSVCGKDYILLCNQTLATTKTALPLFSSGRCRLGRSIHSGDVSFSVPETYKHDGSGYVKVKGTRWFTSFNVYEPELMDLHYEYSPNVHKKFDNIDAIFVASTKEIPHDYYGVMGVPITFLDKWNHTQFELIGGVGRYANFDKYGICSHLQENKMYGTAVGGKNKFFRLLIKRK